MWTTGFGTLTAHWSRCILLLNPEMEADKLQSYVRMYEQSGWMPSFAVLWGDMPCMTGNHAAAWMADAWFKGVQNFDVKKAYEGLKKNSLEATLASLAQRPENVRWMISTMNTVTCPHCIRMKKKLSPRCIRSNAGRPSL